MAILQQVDLAGRVEELKLLQSGWLDGVGVPPLRGGLDWLAESFDHFYPDDVLRPYLFPTPEGDVLAEWPLKPWSITLEIDLAAKSAEWHALQLHTDQEVTKSLDLTAPEDWAWVADQIRKCSLESA